MNKFESNLKASISHARFLGICAIRNGIICEDVILERFDKIMIKLFPRLWWRVKWNDAKIKYRPKSTSLLITARPHIYKKWTEDWLKKNGINNKVIFYKGICSTISQVIEYKASTLKHNKVHSYYESDRNIIEALKKAVGKRCKVKLFNQKRWTLV